MKRKSKLKPWVLAMSSLALLSVAACDRPANAPGSPPSSPSGKPPPSSGNSPGSSTVGQQIEQKADQVTERAKEQASKAGQALDDTAITAAVKAGIVAEPGLKVLKIDVDTKDGRVTLTGSADSTANVKKAEQVASSVGGVKAVENRIVVSKS